MRSGKAAGMRACVVILAVCVAGTSLVAWPSAGVAVEPSVGAVVEHGVSANADDQWPLFRFESTSSVDLSWDLSTVSADVQSIAVRASAHVVIEGNAAQGEARVSATYAIAGNYTPVARDRVFFSYSSFDQVLVPLTPGGPQGGTAVGRFDLLQRISEGITTRSNVFAVWVTTGFFEVSPEPPQAPEANRHRMFSIIDRSRVINLHLADDATDTPWVDLQFPVVTDRTGARYKPLFAFYTMDLDGKLDVNVHGNLRGPSPATVRLEWVLQSPIITTTPDRVIVDPQPMVVAEFSDAGGTRSLQTDIGTVVVGPRPFDLEALAELNLRF